jgi:phage terminase small subunit
MKDSESIDTRSIQEISICKDGQFKFKLYGKDTALVNTGKHLGMFIDKSEVKHEGEIPVRIVEVVKSKREQ